MPDYLSGTRHRVPEIRAKLLGESSYEDDRERAIQTSSSDHLPRPDPFLLPSPPFLSLQRLTSTVIERRSDHDGCSVAGGEAIVCISHCWYSSWEDGRRSGGRSERWEGPERLFGGDSERERLICKYVSLERVGEVVVARGGSEVGRKGRVVVVLGWEASSPSFEGGERVGQACFWLKRSEMLKKVSSISVQEPKECCEILSVLRIRERCCFEGGHEGRGHWES